MREESSEVRTGGVKNLDGDFHHDPKCLNAENFYFAVIFVGGFSAAVN